MDLILSSHMRSGSTWLYRIFAEVFRSHRRAFVSFEGIRPLLGRGDTLLKTHSIWPARAKKLSEEFPDARFILLGRNIYDSLISLATYVRHVRTAEIRTGKSGEMAPETRTFLEAREELDDRTFANQFIRDSRSAQRFIADWKRYCPITPRYGPRLAYVQYESLLHDPLSTIQSVLRGFGYDEVAARLDGKLIARHSFKKMAARTTPRFCDHGTSGHWHSVLDPETVAHVSESLSAPKTTRAAGGEKRGG